MGNLTIWWWVKKFVTVHYQTCITAEDSTGIHSWGQYGWRQYHLWAHGDGTLRGRPPYVSLSSFCPRTKASQIPDMREGNHINANKNSWTASVEVKSPPSALPVFYPTVLRVRLIQMEHGVNRSLYTWDVSKRLRLKSHFTSPRVLKHEDSKTVYLRMRYYTMYSIVFV